MKSFLFPIVSTELEVNYVLNTINSIFAGRSAVEHVHHNHTYHMPAESSGSLQRPVSRDKKGNRQEHNYPIF